MGEVMQLKLHGVCGACQPPPHRLSCNILSCSGDTLFFLFEPPAVPLPFTASFSPPCWLAGWLVNPRRSALVDALFHCFAMPIRSIFISFWSGRAMMMMMMMQQYGFTELSPDKQSIYPHAKKPEIEKLSIYSRERKSCPSTVGVVFLFFFSFFCYFFSLCKLGGRCRALSTKTDEMSQLRRITKRRRQPVHGTCTYILSNDTNRRRRRRSLACLLLGAAPPTPGFFSFSASQKSTHHLKARQGR
ncbi:hypothetical protein B0T26DRAFT_285475 [Lasiosphaeria miniovina]|uniref:Uncharacterized protein n=1 Tax=Lasiosphaeria miniovina TaxID=1954250 RepID=A0AA40AJT5_9PEZI|nr:uncharacterized protein B0T26DRAFT_285475 [Lasiosphaeria miniovina]KAK0717167.1 hypothetical protein B0T26DRAFT_285475 [Lasiosphaeria miniovina]